MVRLTLALVLCAALAACSGGGNTTDPGPGPGDPVPDDPPAKPAGLVATPGNQSVQLTWTANTEADLAYYTVQQWDGDGNSTIVGSVAAPAHAYTATGLTNGSSYTFQVRAVDLAGHESAPSDGAWVSPNTPAEFVSHDGFGPIALGTVAQSFNFFVTGWNDGGLPTGPVELSVAGPDAAYFTTLAGCPAVGGGGACSALFGFEGTQLRSYTATVTITANPGGSFSRTVTVTRGYEVWVGQVSEGIVTSSPSGITCGRSSSQCAKIFGGSDWVTLTVSIANESPYLFQGWTTSDPTNPCPGSSRLCVLPQTSVHVIPAYVMDNNHNRAFVSSAKYPTNLTQAQYDGYCNDLARAAGLNVSIGGALPLYVAWVSSTTASALSRLQAAIPNGGSPISGTWRGWLRVDGKPLADTMSDLAAGRFYHPLSLDEMGRTVRAGAASDRTHTETLPTGAFHSDASCSTGSYEGAGSPWSGAAAWTYNYDAVPCSESKRIYCFMRGRVGSLTAPTVAGKKMWTTSAAIAPGGGVASLDAFCQSHTPAGVVSAKALVATTTQAASDRLSAAENYVTVAGQLIASGADLKANKLPLATGPWFREDGTVPGVPPDLMVMTGAPAVNEVPPYPTTYNCTNWTDATAGRYNAAVGMSDSDSWWFYARGFTDCGAGARLICFEE